MKDFRIIMAAAMFAASALSYGQAGKNVKGRVVDEEGKTVEFVSIGIAGKGVGTVSGIDGRFALQLPAECSDTVIFSHVSYGIVAIPADELTSGDTLKTITMTTKELDEIVVVPGKRKRRRLVNRGMCLAGTETVWSPRNIGHEVGSIVKSKRVFDVDSISFKVLSNGIEGLKLSINICRTDEEGNSFTNILQKPLYTDIPVSEEKQQFTVIPQELIRLHPGIYYVSVKFVGCNESASEEWKDEESWNGPKRFEMRKKCVSFPLHLKDGYKRSGAVDEPERIPINLGLEVHGCEYR